MSNFKKKVVILIIFLLTSINIHAQDIDGPATPPPGNEDGPAPPPPAAPINSLIPAFVTIAIIIGGFTLVKGKNKLDN